MDNMPCECPGVETGDCSCQEQSECNGNCNDNQCNCGNTEFCLGTGCACSGVLAPYNRDPVAPIVYSYAKGDDPQVDVRIQGSFRITEDNVSVIDYEFIPANPNYSNNFSILGTTVTDSRTFTEPDAIIQSTEKVDGMWKIKVKYKARLKIERKVSFSVPIAKWWFDKLFEWEITDNSSELDLFEEVEYEWEVPGCLIN